MSYIESNLLPGEEIKYPAKLSIWALSPIIIVGILLLPVFGLGLILLGSVALTYFTTELCITNKRVVAKFGFIRRNIVEIPLKKIETVQIHQDIPGRIFNYGTIILAGAGNPQAPIPRIHNPLAFRRALLALQEQASL